MTSWSRDSLKQSVLTTDTNGNREVHHTEGRHGSGESFPPSAAGQQEVSENWGRKLWNLFHQWREGPPPIYTHMYECGVCLYMCVMRQSCDEPLKGAFFVVDWEVEECEESSQGMQGLSYQPPSPLPVWECVCPPHFHSIGYAWCMYSAYKSPCLSPFITSLFFNNYYYCYCGLA